MRSHPSTSAALVCMVAAASSNHTVTGTVVSDVASDASDQDALKAFNGLVRECVPMSLTFSIGPTGLTYQHVVAIFLCTLVPTWADIYLLGTLPHPEAWRVRYRLCWAAIFATWTFGIFPLFVALISMVCRL